MIKQHNRPAQATLYQNIIRPNHCQITNISQNHFHVQTVIPVKNTKQLTNSIPYFAHL